MHLTPRLTLQIDALTCGAMAVLLLVLAGPLGGWLDLPVGFLRWVGLVLLPWTALLAWFASHKSVTRTMVQTVMTGNILWIVGSIVVLANDRLEPNAWGVAFVMVQATAVAALTCLQAASLAQSAFRREAMS